MAKKELKKILLKTVPNGYSLTVEGTECMYFNETDMLAGFLTHVGLCETANMDRGTILSTLFSAMLGEAYANRRKHPETARRTAHEPVQHHHRAYG